MLSTTHKLAVSKATVLALFICAFFCLDYLRAFSWICGFSLDGYNRPINLLRPFLLPEIGDLASQVQCWNWGLTIRRWNWGLIITSICEFNLNSNFNLLLYSNLYSCSLLSLCFFSLSSCARRVAKWRKGTVAQWRSRCL